MRTPIAEGTDDTARCNNDRRQHLSWETRREIDTAQAERKMRILDSTAPIKRKMWFLDNKTRRLKKGSPLSYGWPSTGG